ncbi:MAG: YihA family ribosome biogenesis GTP-binding protein [Cytophagales bacterium]|jgi:GTP-binding protein|nr:YihA family ribosome biogenesis GTP-binding protein [Cytophagales bacterium]MCA6378737.1 YihA family ribosome biogenesis GTP-binding protein [Cytophagales bacterium]MCA6387780.1 YihA family ribosome biogenesis GTP-binding protein [Cytophagales bacterium]MCA6390559.1 YihA family ribosome biogenesis GTP-binding protein [Cytophagales bacterium]MCA6399001.1 YihA family ribosome biogenesis GTP-binding protein [Cytophagales bacterium]
MVIKSAEFIISNTDYQKCPETTKPEFAFIGRSNVGKSSLINMLVEQKKLAKVSGTPGKTQTINHFIINQEWFLVDLPGYGYAKLSKEDRWNFGKMIESYLENRQNLFCTFILIDSRLPLQSIDLDFINWMGKHELPIALVLTKTDKLKQSELGKSKFNIESALLKSWEELPPVFITSSEKKSGRDKLLGFIEQAIANTNEID